MDHHDDPGVRIIDCYKCPPSRHNQRDQPRSRQVDAPRGACHALQGDGRGSTDLRVQGQGGRSRPERMGAQAPDADLFDERGRRIGRHFAGPTWEALEDGSQVVGTQIEKTSAPKGGDIPWLLLKRKAGAGKGRFSRVTYIQRVDTEGGIAPARTCHKARQGQEVRVKYKATYVSHCAKGITKLPADLVSRQSQAVPIVTAPWSLSSIPCLLLQPSSDLRDDAGFGRRRHAPALHHPIPVPVTTLCPSGWKATQSTASVWGNAGPSWPRIRHRRTVPCHTGSPSGAAPRRG